MLDCSGRGGTGGEGGRPRSSGWSARGSSVDGRRLAEREKKERVVPRQCLVRGRACGAWAPSRVWLREGRPVVDRTGLWVELTTLPLPPRPPTGSRLESLDTGEQENRVLTGTVFALLRWRPKDGRGSEKRDGS